MFVSNAESNKKLCDILEYILFYTKLKNIKIKKIVMSDRGSWYLEIQNNSFVFLGKEEIVSRLNKFVSFYINYFSREAKYFDLRYRNGIAVGMEFNQNLLANIYTAQGERIGDVEEER